MMEDQEQHSYPWSVLGIRPSSKDIDIKRAYAAKLKLHRPDDDPTSFQQLVEAKELALVIASEERAAENDSEEAVRGSPRSNGHEDTINSSANRIPELQSDVPEIAIPSLSTTENQQQKNEGLGTDEASGPWSQQSDILANIVVKDIKTYLSSSSEEAAFKLALGAVDNIQRLTIADKTSIESELLNTVSEALPTIHYLQSQPGYQTQIAFRNRRKIIYRIDLQYGWTTDDQRIARDFWLENESFADQLQLLIDPDRASQTPQHEIRYEMPAWQKFIGILVLSLMSLKVMGVLFGWSR
jgi:hypothetical protein